MEIKNYLKQGRLLDLQINYHLEKLSKLRQTAYTISSPQISGTKVQNANRKEAPFERALERIEAMEEKINQEIDLLVDLKTQIEGVISQLDCDEYRMVLTYKYLEGKKWEEIANLLNAGQTTVRRWNREALALLKMPEDPIYIRERL